MVKRLLFESKWGDRLLAWLERRFGLAIVQVGELRAPGAGP